MTDRVWSSRCEAADVTIQSAVSGRYVGRAALLLMRGKRYVVDLSLDGELVVTRENSEAFDDRSTLVFGEI